MAWKGIVGQRFTPAQFESYVSKLSFTRWRPQFVVVHNTGAPTLAQRPHGLTNQHMQNLVSYYRDTMKWSAGPHIFVDQNGIWVFTPLTTPGVHSPSWNAVSWGVETLGDYAMEPFGDPVRSNLVACLATLHGAMGIDSHTLRFHREDPRTTHSSCPGRHMVKAELVDAVHEAITRHYMGEHLVAGQVTSKG
ncbi:MAG TPA: peptidoglycan recognition family protein [Capsulimonadaceae bacterium]|jgi:hypothetical protein